jgi:hypothetical protein
VFSIMTRNTCEKSGIPLGARHTGRPFAVPHVYPEGHAPHGLPLLDVVDEALVVVLVVPVMLAPPVLDDALAPPVPALAPVPLLMVPELDDVSELNVALVDDPLPHAASSASREGSEPEHFIVAACSRRADDTASESSGPGGASAVW